MTHRVIIVGGGFAGLRAAQSLRHADVDVTLIDRENYHLFQPLLYQVATGGLSPANIATPLRSILRSQRNATVLMARAVGVDPAKQQLILTDGKLAYDSLIVATGARHHYFGNPQFEAHAPGLKSVYDATTIRRTILGAFEQAERESDPKRIQQWMTFVVIGAGATGLELSGTIAELARQTLRREFRRIDTTRSRVILIEGRERVMPGYSEYLSGRAEDQLRRMGVDVRLNALVRFIDGEKVVFESSGKETTIDTSSVFWAAGVQASPIGKAIAAATGAELDRAGRVMVSPDCSVPGCPSLFVVGDLAHQKGPDGNPLPGTASVAQQQGRYVASVIRKRLAGKPHPPFSYRNMGQMATIGRAAAIVELGRYQFGGFLAWLTWLFLHLILLVGFQNRMLVLFQWFWNYITRNRSARLITRYGTGETAVDDNDLGESERPSPLAGSGAEHG